jgi:hypothetical protein
VPWLRGLWRTPVIDWSGDFDGADDAADIPHLLIGWWPRYPSALPRNTLSSMPGHLSGEDFYYEALWRSRCFPWAAFPVSVLELTPETSTLTVSGSGNIAIQSRATVGDFDWPQDQRANFASLNDTKADGVELRAWWVYTGSNPSDFDGLIGEINENPPLLEQVDLGVSAETLILERRDAR